MADSKIFLSVVIVWITCLLVALVVRLRVIRNKPKQLEKLGSADIAVSASAFSALLHSGIIAMEIQINHADRRNERSNIADFVGILNISPLVNMCERLAAMEYRG